MDRGAWRATVHGVEKSWTQTEATEHECTCASVKNPEERKLCNDYYYFISQG